MPAAANDPGAASEVLAPPSCGVPSGTPRRSSLRFPLSLPGSFASLAMTTRTDSWARSPSEAELLQAARILRPARLDAHEELEEHLRAKHRLQLESRPPPDLAETRAACPDDDPLVVRAVDEDGGVHDQQVALRLRAELLDPHGRAVGDLLLRLGEELLADQLLREETLALGRVLVLGVEPRPLWERLHRRGDADAHVPALPPADRVDRHPREERPEDRKSTRLNSSHSQISYA